MFFGSEVTFVLQGLTDEMKRVQDESLWKDWLDNYTDRLRQEVDGDLTNGSLKAAAETRIKLMNSNNPRFVCVDSSLFRNNRWEYLILAALAVSSREWFKPGFFYGGNWHRKLTFEYHMCYSVVLICC